jgi:hypothetical protein
MPTLEERLAAVEQASIATQQFHQELARRAQENDENLTTLLGLIRHQGQDLRRLADRLDAMDARLAEQAQTLAAHTVLLNQILAR